MNSHFSRMEKAIRFIEDRARKQPSLQEISRHVGLSPCHFQRVFKRWTGVSPKRYLQILTVEHAKRLLDLSIPVLETAYEAGLSGQGRLHDLFVTAEAVSPGQYRSRGAGVDMKYGFHRTPFGRAMIAVTGMGITDLWFVDDLVEGESVLNLRRRWPAARTGEFIIFGCACGL